MALYQHQECQEFFPELEETQKEHMLNQRQVVWSTQKPNSTTDLNSADIIELPPIEKKKKYLYHNLQSKRDNFLWPKGKIPTHLQQREQPTNDFPQDRW